MNLFDFQLALTKVSHDLDGLQQLIELARIRGDLDKWLPRLQPKIAERAIKLKELAETQVGLTKEE